MAEAGPPAAIAERTTGHPYIGNTVVVAVVSALSYAATYQYERAFCDYFRIPTSLIVVNLTTVLAIAVGLLGVALVSLLFFNFLYMVTPSPILRSLRRLVFPLGLTSVYVILIKPSGTELLLILSMPAFIFL